MPEANCHLIVEQLSLASKPVSKGVSEAMGPLPICALLYADSLKIVTPPPRRSAADLATPVRRQLGKQGCVDIATGGRFAPVLEA